MLYQSAIWISANSKYALNKQSGCPTDIGLSYLQPDLKFVSFHAVSHFVIVQNPNKIYCRTKLLNAVHCTNYRGQWILAERSLNTLWIYFRWYKVGRACIVPPDARNHQAISEYCVARNYRPWDGFSPLTPRTMKYTILLSFQVNNFILSNGLQFILVTTPDNFLWPLDISGISLFDLNCGLYMRSAGIWVGTSSQNPVTLIPVHLPLRLIGYGIYIWPRIRNSCGIKYVCMSYIYFLRICC